MEYHVSSKCRIIKHTLEIDFTSCTFSHKLESISKNRFKNFYRVKTIKAWSSLEFPFYGLHLKFNLYQLKACSADDSVCIDYKELQPATV